jgi:hypothetical protein
MNKCLYYIKKGFFPTLLLVVVGTLPVLLLFASVYLSTDYPVLGYGLSVLGYFFIGLIFVLCSAAYLGCTIDYVEETNKKLKKRI